MIDLAGRLAAIDLEGYESEHHVHSYERWFGTAVTPDGEVHVADRIGTATTALQIDAGNDTWGSWTQVLGGSDTPATAGMTKYDFHRIFVSATERTAVHFIQFGFGASGAAALSSGDYTEFVFEPSSNQVEEAPIELQGRRQDVGTKVWARAYIPGQNTGTISFFAGLHEYER